MKKSEDERRKGRVGEWESGRLMKFVLLRIGYWRLQRIGAKAPLGGLGGRVDGRRKIDERSEEPERSGARRSQIPRSGTEDFSKFEIRNSKWKKRRVNCLNQLWIISLVMALSSCEEVVEIDLRNAEPLLNIEAVIFKDSVCNVKLTMTADYFSAEEPEDVGDAVIKISNGNAAEFLNYSGNGRYRGSTITGTPGEKYTIEILNDGITYTATSTMPGRSEIRSSHYSKSNEVSILNPEGETVYTINCRFDDDPAVDNFYMICYRSRGALIEQRFFMLTESSANGGSFEKTGDLISFSESIFFDGGIVDVQLFTMDEPVYQYFKQLDDVLFWKRRYIPPVPYNPKSNLSNGALGYFAAMGYDYSTLVLE